MPWQPRFEGGSPPSAAESHTRYGRDACPSAPEERVVATAPGGLRATNPHPLRWVPGGGSVPRGRNACSGKAPPLLGYNPRRVTTAVGAQAASPDTCWEFQPPASRSLSNI